MMDFTEFKKTKIEIRDYNDLLSLYDEATKKIDPSRHVFSINGYSFLGGYNSGFQNNSLLSSLQIFFKQRGTPQSQLIVVFENCYFESYSTVLDRSVFRRIDFKNCRFSKLYYADAPVIFSECQFGDVVFSAGDINSDLNFSDCFFLGSFITTGIRVFSAVIFDKCNFRRAKESAPTQDVDFSGVQFAKKIRFLECVFDIAPKFDSKEINFDTLFRNCKYSDVTSEGAVERWSSLKHLMQEKAFDIQAAEFHAAEIHAKRKRLRFFSRDAWEKTCSWILYLMTNYGRNLLLPFVWLGLFFLISSWLYMGHIGCNPKAMDDAAIWLQGVCNDSSPIRKAMVYSSLQTLGPLGIIYSDTAFGPLTLSYKVISFVHFLLSSIVIFVLLFQTRAKFKL